MTVADLTLHSEITTPSLKDTTCSIPKMSAARGMHTRLDHPCGLMSDRSEDNASGSSDYSYTENKSDSKYDDRGINTSAVGKGHSGTDNGGGGRRVTTPEARSQTAGVTA